MERLRRLSLASSRVEKQRLWPEGTQGRGAGDQASIASDDGSRLCLTGAASGHKNSCRIERS